MSERDVNAVEEAVAVREWHDAQLRGRVRELHTAGLAPCASCPWRQGNQCGQLPQTRIKTTLSFYACDGAGIQTIWDGLGYEDGMRDGACVGCHCGTLERRNFCAGAEAILHRELLRWWEAGGSRHTFEPFTGLSAIQRLLAHLLALECDPVEPGVVGAGWSTPGLSLAEGGPDRVEPHLYGPAVQRLGRDLRADQRVPLPLEVVAPILHPGVLDPEYTFEGVRPLEDDEVVRWRALHVGEHWRYALERRVIRFERSRPE